ncbi:MAG TPA: hypothetical protein VF658_18070 [Pyrinomonadaceae bacterium]|jgi:hypothetical protein
MTKDRANLVPWITCAVVLLVYLCFPTKQYFFDGVDFAWTIESAPALDTSLIHPNHLFYEGFGYLIYRAVRGIGLEARALTVLQITNSFLSALAALVLFHILRLTALSLYLSAALTFLFAFSATWWKFSIDANAYVPSVLFILLSFYLILPDNKQRPLVLALCYSLSMCFHQLAVVFFPVLVLGLFWQTPAQAARQRVLTVLKFSIAAFVLTFGLYYYFFYLATGTLDFSSLMRWITSFSPDASFSFNAGSNLSYTLRGFTRLFFGGRFNLLRGITNPFIVVLMIVLAILVALLFLTVIRNLRELKTRWQRAINYDSRLKPVLLLCVLWISVYTAFLFVWLPHHTFYRLFYLPALILLIGILLARGESLLPPARTYALALIVAVMSLCNFLFLIFPYSHVEKYPPLALALEMNRVWPRGTVIYYYLTNADASLFRYFNPPTVWKQLKTGTTDELENELRSIYSAGGTVWLEVTAIEQLLSQPQGAAWLSAHAREESRRELVDKAYKIKFVQIAP